METSLAGLPGRRLHGKASLGKLNNRSGLRVATGFADQVVSTATNVGVSILVARALSAEQFGHYGLVVAIYLVAMGVSRSATTEPLASMSGDRAALDNPAPVVGTALAVGLVFCLGIASLSLAIGAAAHWLVLAVVLPGLLQQDCCRQILIIDRRAGAALLNDTIWGLGAVAGLAYISATSTLTVSSAIAVWGLSGGVAGVIGSAQLGQLPNPFGIAGWYRSNRDLIRPFVAEFSIAAGLQQATLFAVAVFASVEAVGALRAAQILFGPVNLLLAGSRLVGIPEMKRLLIRRPSAGFKFSIGTSACLALLTSAWAVVAFLGTSLFGEALLGASAAGGIAILLPIAIYKIAVSLTTGSMITLRALEAAKSSLLVRGAISLANFVLVASAAAISGASGMAWAMALVGLMGAALWWLATSHNLRKLEAQ